MLTGIIIDNLSMKTNNPKVKIFYETSLGLKLCNFKSDLVSNYNVDVDYDDRDDGIS